ncbi:MAG: glycosyltransferase [Halioglobus sp.]|nr:glycosyltransferase [Halioglobus sp.]
MPDAGSTSFDIVVPTYGRSESLSRTLSALSEQSIPAGLQYVHVVENGPKFGAEQVCDSFSGKLPIRYHYIEEPGVNGARNLGARTSRADFVLFFDDDVKPVTGALACYAEAFSRLGQHCFFGGPLVPDYEEPPADWLVEFLPNSARGFSLGEQEVVVDGPVFIGSNFAVPRVTFDELGYFDGPCPTGATGGGLGDETRLLQRLMAGGYAGVYLPQAGVLHWVPKNRCDARFMRHRSWRHGFGDGQIFAANFEGQARVVFDAPVWCWRKLLGSCVDLVGVLKPGFTPSLAFQRLLHVYWESGFISGYREVRRGKNGNFRGS